MIYIGLSRARREGWTPAANTACSGRARIAAVIAAGAIAADVTYNGDRAQVSWVTHYFYPPSQAALAAWLHEATAKQQEMAIPCACGGLAMPGIAGLAERHHCQRSTGEHDAAAAL